MIKLVRRLFAEPKDRRILLGVGDDAALLVLSRGKVVVVTTDMLVEGVDFLLPQFSPREVAAKSVAVNLSDLAAMGAEPVCILLSLGMPRRSAAGFHARFFSGIENACRHFGVSVAGGDLSATLDDIVVSVTAIGEARTGRLVKRSGAGPGDLVFVTGELGSAAAGLMVLKENAGPAAFRRYRSLVKAQKAPSPPLSAGRLLASAGVPTAMIDLSDGLSSDLMHIAEESGVDAVVDAGSVPISAACRAFCAAKGLDARDLALRGGEDFELCFTVPPEKVRLLEKIARRANIRVTAVGEITEKSSSSPALRITGFDGRKRRIKGFDHFDIPHPMC